MALGMLMACSDGQPHQSRNDGLAEVDGGLGGAQAPREVFEGCGERSTSSCASEPDCRAITGTQYDETRHCRWEAPVAVGCMQRDQSCKPAVVYARDPGAEEVAFEIVSGCIPPKFTRLDAPSDGPSSWPLCTSEAVCSIDAQVARRATGQQVVDCGNLPRLADTAARATADRCVLDAQSAQRPFKLIVWMQGTDSNIAYAYVSPGAGAKVSVLQYDSAFSQFSATGGGSIGVQTCSSLRAVTDCQASASTFCLECVDESEFSKVCAEPAR
jgi:hypothetical protein